MITLIIALAAACGVFSALFWGADWGVGWSIFVGVVSFGVVQGVAGFLVRKRVTLVMQRVQQIMVDGQKQLQAKVQRWQFRPLGSVKEMQREMMKDTKGFVAEALKATEELARFRPWVLMIDRQMATAQLQLNWMVKDFEKVDALLPRALMLDPTLAAMKMARMYMLERPSAEIEKVYRKAVGRLRYNQNVLLAAAWSWMLMQRKDHDGAFKVLTEALKKSDNEALKRNHEALMNNRPYHFNNSGVGDVWYQLYLEEPKTHTQRQHCVYR